MKAKSPIFRRSWLLFLLTIMPMCIKAQMVEKPFLCIEKTNGEVIKVLITETKPELWYSYSNENGEQGRFLCVIYSEDYERIYVSCDDIKRLTTKFELVDTSALGIKSDDDSTSDVYSLSGIRVGSFAHMSSLPKGIYLIKKGSRTIKYVNR